MKKIFLLLLGISALALADVGIASAQWLTPQQELVDVNQQLFLLEQEEARLRARRAYLLQQLSSQKVCEPVFRGHTPDGRPILVPDATRCWRIPQGPVPLYPYGHW